MLTKEGWQVVQCADVTCVPVQDVTLLGLLNEYVRLAPCKMAEDKVGLLEDGDCPVWHNDLALVLSRRFDRAQVSRLVGAYSVGIVPILERLKLLVGPCQFQGAFAYPPGGYMGWHTNHGTPGRRLYLTWVEYGVSSFFRYRDRLTGAIVTMYDQPGWHARRFEIGEPDLWHCVYARTMRYSLGFLLLD